MKPTTVSLLAIFAPLAAAQDDPYTETLLGGDCWDSCVGLDNAIVACDLLDHLGLTFEEHKACACESGIAAWVDCNNCGKKVNRIEEDDSLFDSRDSLISSYSTAMCAPSNTARLSAVMEAVMTGGSPGVTPLLRPLPEMTPTPTMVQTVRETTSRSSSDSGMDSEEEQDDSGDGDETGSVTTGGSPAQTQTPLALAAIGVAIMAAL